MSSGASDSTIPLEAVITTPLLFLRQGRAPDFAAENKAMLELAHYLSERPEDILQKLTEIAVTLCHAGSAGVSIIEEENEVFRWHALAGELAEHRWGTTPRFFSPCGTVVDTAAVQLMTNLERHFAYFADVKPTIVEALLIPFSVHDKIVGTVWVVMHDSDQHFDCEDVRIITSLATFAAAGFKTQKNQKGLETAIRNRDEFLAVLGHELRNPLSPLATAHRLLSIRQLDDKTRWTAVDVIGRQLTLMQRLVDDILDLSRIAEGKLAITKLPVAIDSLVREAVEMVKSKAAQARLKLKTTLPTDPIYINADSVRMMQIINNVLNNAIKFTPAYGNVFVEVQQNNDAVCISIRDSGIGLAPENLQSIFAMFSQVEGATRNNKGGLGIGLGLAKTLTELHDGTVTVRSAGLNLGCEFIIKLPVLVESQVLSAPQPESELPSAIHALRILIADDSPDCADSLGVLLRMKGYEVCVAYDGLDTVSQAREWAPHVALVDLSLPGLSGYEVVEQLRLDPATRHSMIVAITGHATDVDRERTKECGFDVHMIKPVNLDELFKLLESRFIYEGAERRFTQNPFHGPDRRRMN